MSAKAAADSGDVVANWDVPLRDKVHKVLFEHGAVLTGKRVVRVDGVPVVRKDVMFSLLGSEPFRIGNTKCRVVIETVDSGWKFKYTLFVEDKPLSSYVKDSGKKTRTWLPMVQGKTRRVVLEIDDIGVYVDGQGVQTTGEFLESDDEDTVENVIGSAHNFLIDDTVTCRIKVYSSGNKFEGLKYDLYIQEKLIATARPQDIASTT